MGRDRKIAGLWAAGAASLSLVAVHAILGTYSRFMSDDYCSAAVARSKGIVGGTVHWYFEWSGRFSANLLDSLAGAAGPALTPYAPGIALGVWLGVIAVAVYPLTASQPVSSRIGVALPSAAILMAATLLVAPDVFQSVYWGQGMRSVVPPLVVGTAIAGLFFRVRTRDSGRSILVLAAFGFLAFLAGGFAETWVVLQSFLLGISILIVATRRSEERPTSLRILAVALAFSILAMRRQSLSV